MTTIYLLLWPRTLTQTANDGTQLTFSGPAGSVAWHNDLASPGTRLHTWSSRPVGTGWGVLPLLQPETDYYIAMATQLEKQAMYAAVEDYDTADNLLERTDLPALAGSFSSTPASAYYTISLINMHQVDFTFLYGVLMPAAVHEQVTMQVNMDQQTVRVVNTDASVTQPRRLTLVRRSAGTFPLPLAGARDELFIYGTSEQWATDQWRAQLTAKVRAVWPAGITPPIITGDAGLTACRDALTAIL
ncbi:accessory Sec system protein Asp3 [Schleiferilactobacillus shenzhenensis]|uniref:accessory Sec system protein Asp3 n=1 Tax=Schleiferilactobacillus shenzhenensis TaxID=1231337 RepID=UPI00058B2EA9|nr:accessory Sec system protein Asp3 [Schleiferilactobacillus shenzhenensis]